MYIVKDTLDDLMFTVLETLVELPFDGTPTKAKAHGKTSEIQACTLELTNPRARLSRSETRGKIFSAIGELLWYLSKTNDVEFISYYISEYQKLGEDGGIYGGYGPRIFNLNKKYNQLDNIISRLKENSQSRKAVIQIFDGEDIAGDIEHIDVPCTCTLQFLVRNNKLNLIVYMRSNDAYKGLPHDIFAFTMLQEIVANSLGVELGVYTHIAGSLHLYENSTFNVKKYLAEGYQSTKIFMPEMPKVDPWTSISLVLSAEKELRNSNIIDIDTIDIDVFWRDLINLLKAFSITKSNEISTDAKVSELEHLKKQLANPMYEIYIDAKIDLLK